MASTPKLVTAARLRAPRLPKAPPAPGVVYPPKPDFGAIRKQARADAARDRERLSATAPPVISLRPKPRVRLPRLWLAVGIHDAQVFEHLLIGERHVIQVCECKTCRTLLDQQIRGRSHRERGRARLVMLLLTARERAGVGTLSSKLLLARGVKCEGPNLTISRVVIVEQANLSAGLLTPQAMQRLHVPHIVALPSTLFSPTVASLVARLPAPISPGDRDKE